jgi:glycosyltransferase involved in cell wall biosynthesis
MKISVVIAVYNDLEIVQCVRSIYASDPVVDSEVIVVDDGSSEIDVESLLAGHGLEARVFTLEENRGPAYARNFGVRQASGDIIFFIDADAQVYPNTLSGILAHFIADFSVDAVTIAWSDTPLVDNFFNKFKAVETNYVINEFWEKSFGSNGSAIKKQVFEAEGGFDEGFKSAHAEDFSFGLRLVDKEYNIVLDRAILMKNAYLDNFFWQGLRKYCLRAFLRAQVMQQTAHKVTTSYNSRKFKIAYALVLSTTALLAASFLGRELAFLGLVVYAAFFALNLGLYRRFFTKYGIAFSVRAVSFHFIYLATVSWSGMAGLGCGMLRNLKILNN